VTGAEARSGQSCPSLIHYEPYLSHARVDSFIVKFRSYLVLIGLYVDEIVWNEENMTNEMSLCSV
jgi:hypothetical protein